MDTINIVLSAVSSVLLGIVGFFLMRLIQKIDENTTAVTALSVRMEQMESDVLEARKVSTEVAILKVQVGHLQKAQGGGNGRCQHDNLDF